MTKPATSQKDDIEPEQLIFPDLDCHVTNDDEFRAAVAEGMVDIKAGRTSDFETVITELRELIATKS